MLLRQLRCYLSVIGHSSLSRAARELGVTQSAVSQSIAALERDMGCKLLVRSASGVRPTDAGRVLATRARDLISLADDTCAEVRRVGADSDEPIVLGVPHTVVDSRVEAAVSALAVERPGLSVQVRRAPSVQLAREVECGSIDLALIDGRLEPAPGILTHSLATFDLMAEVSYHVAPAGCDLLDVCSLSDVPCLVVAGEADAAEECHGLATLLDQTHVRVRAVDSAVRARELVCQGRGLLPVVAGEGSPTPEGIRRVRLTCKGAPVGVELRVWRAAGTPRAALSSLDRMLQVLR